MEENILFILKKYIEQVEIVCGILVKNINCAENLNLKNKEDLLAYRSSCKKMEFEAEGISYRFHGKGCVAYNKEMFIDWEFGYGSRWCGIDPWKVSITLKKNRSKYDQNCDGNFIREICEKLVEKGTLVMRYGQYYFTIPENETFKPQFPEEYDMLIIEYFDDIWSIARNKIIDKFIRKSTYVHNKIEMNTDKYLLRFLLRGKEVYSIFYDDISYPESAVKIMSDEIIKRMKR